jgi:hypothetical protein
MRAPISRFGALGPLACAACVALAALGCGNSAPPAAPPPGPEAAGAPGPAAPTDSPAAAANAAPAPAEAAPPRKQRPLPITNYCSEIVTVVFGEDPNAATSGKRAIAAGSTIEGPRDAEGKMTVHLLDEHGEKLATVHVTRGMKKVDIGASCRTLDAR